MNASAAADLVGRREHEVAVEARRGRCRSPRGRSACPPRITGGSGCSWKWNAVTMPKLPPPPRRPQNRSAFSVSDADHLAAVGGDDLGLDRGCRTRTRTCARSSRCRCRARDRRCPVVGTRPPVTTSPCSVVAASNSPQVSPPSARTVCASRVDADALHAAQVDADPAVDDRRAGHAVATAVDRQRRCPGRGRGSPPRRRRRRRAAGDEHRAAVDHAVEDGPGLVVAGVARARRARLGSRGARRSRYRWWPWVLRSSVPSLGPVSSQPSPAPDRSRASDRRRLLRILGVMASASGRASGALRSDDGCSSGSSGSVPSGVLLGAQAQDWLERAVGPLIAKDGTGLASLLPIGRFRIYTVTGDLPSRSRAELLAAGEGPRRRGGPPLLRRHHSR